MVKGMKRRIDRGRDEAAGRERKKAKQCKTLSAGCCVSAGVRGSIWCPGASMSEMRGGESAEPINYGPSSPTLH